MHPQHQNEIWLLIVITALAGVFGGILFDQAMLCVAIVLLIYIALTLRNIFKLHFWLVNRKEAGLPEAQGFWGEIFNEIHLMEKENSKNRSRLTAMLIRFQDAADALPDGMVILNKRNRIEWANPAACRMLGIVTPKDIGQTMTNLLRHPDFLQYLLANDFSREIRLPSPRNSQQSLNLQIIPYGSSQKLIICRDVTHVTRLEAMRSQFVANVSHELRSPITVLSGYLETLRNIHIQSGKELERPLMNMTDQVKRMERLVTDLLMLSRLETEPVKFTNNIVNVPGMLSQIKESAELLSGEKQHDLRFEIDERLQVLGNQEELRSLFTNLISNAIRYTPAHGLISIKWERVDGQARFAVIDTGPGIAAHHIPNLTRRFYRVDADRSRETGGTGLGLAIVKHVLERHDSELVIESVLDKGSTFSCCFPAERVVKRPLAADNKVSANQ